MVAKSNGVMACHSPRTRMAHRKVFTILATCPARWAPGDSLWYDKWPSRDHSGNAVLGVYQNGGTVFTCGSTGLVPRPAWKRSKGDPNNQERARPPIQTVILDFESSGWTQ